MKELCIDVRMAFHAGVGTYIRNIVPSLASLFKLRLIANKGLLQKWPFLNQCDLILTSTPIYSFEEQIKFPFLIPACDLFWTPHYNVPLGSLKSKKRFVTIHDVYHLAFGKTLGYLQRHYAKIVINRAVKISDHILTISQFSKDEIIKHTGVSSEKISSVHLGVDRSRFSDQISHVHLREKYNLPSNYFLFVGTLAPHKNIGRLIEAWSHVVRKFPAWKLVLVGKRSKSGSWEPPLQNSLLFLGQVEDQDLPGLYRGAYAAIHPSLYEGFGLTPLEAMSCGCPTIVSRVASLPEICGDSSFYIDPYDVKDIASGIEKMIQDPDLHNDLKIKGLKRLCNFTWEKTIEKHVEIMETFA